MSNTNRWAIDLAHSKIEFKIRHLVLAHVTGSFETFDTNVYTTNNDFTTAEIDVWIDATSINTGDEKRDEHLKSADFFDVLAHKQISFKASGIEQKEGDTRHDLWGDLTIKGITKNIKLQVEFADIVNDSMGKQRVDFVVTGKINRKDWALGWNTTMDTGDLMLGNEVKIYCEIELINTINNEQTTDGNIKTEISASL
jgi:polyisoprenoid-binding protein YceI